MANQATPNVVANTFVRYILTQAGLSFGGFTVGGTNDQWQATLVAFDHKCAYTGQQLTGLKVEKEHAVAMNRTGGGLHVYGNVVPSTPQANAQKLGLRYDEFLRSRGDKFSSIAHLSDDEREAAIVRIEDFMQSARPDGLLDPHPELLAFYKEQYEVAKSLCAQAQEKLQALLQKLQLEEVPAETDAGQLDLPTAEQLELEEESASDLPPAYQALQTQYENRKIGVYAQAVFRALFADGHIAQQLETLTRPDESLARFKLSFPLFTTRRQEAPARYYADAYHLNGTDYYLCNHWYERSRDYLDSWLTETVFGQSRK